MEIIFVIISIFYATVIVFLSITWYKDVLRKEDTDKRILVLEKRDAEKVDKEYFYDTEHSLLGIMQQHDLLIDKLEKKVGKLEKQLPKNNK